MMHEMLVKKMTNENVLEKMTPGLSLNEWL